MRTAMLLAAAFAATTAATTIHAQVLFEDFEDASVTYTTSTPEFSDGAGDFFTRTDGSNIGGFVEYSGQAGNGWFAGMDLDGEGADLPLTMDFSVDISGFENLMFSVLLAEDDDGSNEDWDESDFVHIDFQIDGGGFQSLLWIENDGSEFNSAPRLDTDFDGTGDGMMLTDEFTEFMAAIGGTGDLLDLRITFQLNAGDEDIALDNVTILGTPAVVPVPAAAWLLLSGLAALGLRRRRG